MATDKASGTGFRYIKTVIVLLDRLYKLFH